MSSRPSSLRTFLVLARASNLPTVWSNCLAGWLLAGGGDWIKFAMLCLGASFLYTGGMFLNDAFDAHFDRQYRPERPIPSGAITEREVWRWGINLLVLGALLLVWMGVTTAVLTLILIGCILLYDAIHKLITIAPVIMASCRFALYLVAASAGQLGVTGLAVWSAFALAFYIVGLSYLARRESASGPLQYWPLVFLATPVALSTIVNSEPASEVQQLGLSLSAVLLLWVLWCLRHVFWSAQPQIGRVVSGLLAGIALVDLLAVADAAPMFGFVFAALFIVARLFQKLVPAT